MSTFDAFVEHSFADLVRKGDGKDACWLPSAASAQ
jgi:hypothetical protein